MNRNNFFKALAENCDTKEKIDALTSKAKDCKGLYLLKASPLVNIEIEKINSGWTAIAFTRDSESEIWGQNNEFFSIIRESTKWKVTSEIVHRVARWKIDRANEAREEATEITHREAKSLDFLGMLSQNHRVGMDLSGCRFKTISVKLPEEDEFTEQLEFKTMIGEIEICGTKTSFLRNGKITHELRMNLSSKEFWTDAASITCSSMYTKDPQIEVNHGSGGSNDFNSAQIIRARIAILSFALEIAGEFSEFTGYKFA